MITIEYFLRCQHTITVPFDPKNPPSMRMYSDVHCRQCGASREVVDVDPSIIDTKTVTLSRHEPRQELPYGGFTAGDKATIFYSPKDGSWGYCFHGVGFTGLAYETDNVTGFSSEEEALQAAIEAYQESLEEFGEDW